MSANKPGFPEDCRAALRLAMTGYFTVGKQHEPKRVRDDPARETPTLRRCRQPGGKE